MIERFLKLSGMWPSGDERLVDVHTAIHPAVHPALLVALGVVLAAGVVWLYRREHGELHRSTRVAAASLRIALVAIMLLILAQPVIAIVTSVSARASLAVLVDTSSSMQIADVRDAADDKLRAAIAQGKADARAGLTQTPPAAVDQPISRIELVKDVLRNPQLRLTDRLSTHFQMSVFTFDRELNEVADAAGPKPWAEKLTATGSATALGNAIEHVLVAKRGEALGGVLIISDGASNTGVPLATAAQLAHDERVPLYIYGVGVTAPRDVQVESMLAPEIAFVRNELPVTVRVRTSGYRSGVAKVVLKMDGAAVASSDLALDQDGERTVSMRFSPEKTGSFALQASIEPRPDEVVADNNVGPPKQIRIVDTRIKVLHIEQSPRWEFKYLQAALMRDPRIEYSCLLLDADTEVASVAGSPFILGFPKPAELSRYDLVILGDVDPRRLPAGAMDQLNSFVADYGGGFIMIAGPRAAPFAYRRTPVERMLPVDFDVTGVVPLGGEGERPIHLELTPAGAANSMLRLADTDEGNARRWQTLSPLYWTARVSGPKPAAEVLAVDPDPAKSSRLGKMPVIALQQYGAGQVLYVGTDNTWRWRRNDDLDIFNRVWAQIIDRMAMSHLLGAAGNTQLSLDRTSYAPGDRATVYARLYREGGLEPLTLPTIDAYTTATDQPARQSLILHSLPDQPGIYRGDFTVGAAGRYTLKSEVAPKAAVEFYVVDTQIEHGEAGLNAAGLRELAERTGGAFVQEEGLYHLPDVMRHESKPVLYTREVEIWSNAAFFVVPLALAGAEWWIRKRALLK